MADAVIAAIPPGRHARLIVPRLLQRGEDFTARLLIQHPMETGFRRDDTGKVLPANVIENVVLLFNDELVFRGRVLNALSANPSLSVQLTAQKSGTLSAHWRDQMGNVGSISTEVRVAGA
ncbi:MAG: thiosulfate oxidation carrier complex protein SoxZ [Betaproteobacteria bacterium]|nr:MAG: thiosulfate oxidation carrier complex protein SoxZ [Betaproteobacteria bacterium]TAG48534.1 MAG: thiosulfate oxidation carrier complex protein SoxZ [Betaproteobacteria bacterium]TAG76990.1 MAG: thiosulfate oxidation carrier complex protein SoxZ [Betaproteobacteria bacterium]